MESASCSGCTQCLLPLGDAVRLAELRALALQTSSKFFMQEKRKLVSLKCMLAVSQMGRDRYNLSVGVSIG